MRTAKSEPARRGPAESSPAASVLQIPIARVKPDPDQPRKRFNKAALELLAQSLKKRGQRIPGIVRPSPDSDTDYILIDGERRWRAAKLAGIGFYRAVLSDSTTADEWFEESVIANFGKEEHTHQEIANAVVRMRESGMTVERIAEGMTKTPSYIFQHLQLLKLDPRVRAMVDDDLPEKDQLGYSIAVLHIAKIEDPKRQLEATLHIVKERMNIHQARAYLSRLGQAHGFATRRNRPSDNLPVVESFISRLMADSELVLTMSQKDFSAILQARSLHQIEKLPGVLDTACSNLGAIRQAIIGVIDNRRRKQQEYGNRHVA